MVVLDEGGSARFAVILLLLTPGPGVLSTAGVGSAFGPWRGILYVTGLFLGTNAVAVAVISGLSASLFSASFPPACVVSVAVS